MPRTLRRPVAGQVLDRRLTVSDLRLQLDVREAGIEVARQDQAVLDRQREIGIDRLERACQGPGEVSSPSPATGVSSGR